MESDSKNKHFVLLNERSIELFQLSINEILFTETIDFLPISVMADRDECDISAYGKEWKCYRAITEELYRTLRINLSKKIREYYKMKAKKEAKLWGSFRELPNIALIYGIVSFEKERYYISLN